MNKIISLLGLMICFAISTMAQNPAPGLFNYQGVARNSVGNALINKTISLRLTIHDGTATGPVIYQESRSVTTNPFGLFNVQVGSAGASNVTGTIANVNLGVGIKYIQVEIDPNGGTAFIHIGAAQLASVPYSLYTSLSNDLVLPFNKTQAEPGALFKITNSGSGITLHTTGPLRLQGIGEAANRILASDASGNASWKDPAAVNIVTGSGTVNFLPKWTPGSTNLGNSLITDNGNSIGVNTSAPSASAQLELSSTTRGLLVPRMSSVQRTTISSPANGLLVFDNTTNSFWFYNSSAWTELLSAASGWSLKGNAGTSPASNFIGTTDNTDLIFRRNNSRAGSIGITNTSFGFNALNPGSTGPDNTAIGVSALGSNTTGVSNTANGYGALYSNTTGNSNTATGVGTLYFNTTGSGNTASGDQALLSNTTGNFNTATGGAALSSNTFGSGNTAQGANALTSNTTGSNNTASGKDVLRSNTTGFTNTAYGSQALYTNITGSENTATGSAALFSNTTGSGNTANGVSALGSNTTGIYNTASGYQALFKNNSAANNTAHGAYSLYANLNGGNNSATGAYSLTENTSGSNNTANGWLALNGNTTGSDNSAVGAEALKLNTTGRNNTANGSAALKSNTTGDYNTAIGKDALLSNTTGFENTAGGTQALASITTGMRNTAIGSSALVANSTGDFNTALGGASLIFSTGSNNIGIGYFAQVPVAAGSNQVRIGNGATAYAGVEVAWTITSDRRKKSDIQTTALGLDFIRSLHPVSYSRINDANKKTEFGFIAQEVEEALHDAGAANTGIITKDDAGLYGVRYNDFIAPMVRAIQEQQELILQQKKQIDDLEKRLLKLEKILTSAVR